MEDYELFPDEEEEAAPGEAANRVFIIAVAALGGLLALGICAFFAWAFVINPRMRADIGAINATTEASNATALAAQADETPTAEVSPEATEPPVTEPSPTATETLAPIATSPPAQAETPTEAPETPAVTATPAEVAEGLTATATPRPTATRRPTATPKPGNGEVPGTGVGMLGASATAAGLVFLLALVRRMRRAV